MASDDIEGRPFGERAGMEGGRPGDGSPDREIIGEMVNFVRSTQITEEDYQPDC